MMRWILAALHLLAFGIGFAAIWMRGSALRSAAEPGNLARALRADIWWGVAALLWLGTGLPRLFAGTEKATAYYLASHTFWLKMALFLGLILLELGPALALGRWRNDLRRGRSPDSTRAPRWASISRVQLALLIALLLAATAMARGI